jgi:hypothetical protein
MGDGKETNFGKSLLSKVKEQLADAIGKKLVPWLVPLVLGYFTKYWPAARAIVWDRKVSLGYLVLACVPCLYLLVLVVVASKGNRVAIVANPVTVHISEGFNAGTRAVTLNFMGQLTIGNAFEDSLILLYAYTRFVKPDAHFMRPFVVPPRTAQGNFQLELMGPVAWWWWRWRRPPNRSRVKFRVAFVSIGGRRYWTNIEGTYHRFSGLDAAREMAERLTPPGP